MLGHAIIVEKNQVKLKGTKQHEPEAQKFAEQEVKSNFDLDKIEKQHLGYLKQTDSGFQTMFFSNTQ